VAQLVLRVQAVLRRSHFGADATQRIALGDNVELDVPNLSGRRAGDTLSFTRREMDVLQHLHANADRPVSREELLTIEADEVGAQAAFDRLASESADREAAAIAPLELSLLDSGHFVLYRKIWRNGQRYVQGMLIDQSPFLQGAIEGPFRETGLSGLSDLVVAYQGRVLSLFPAWASARQYGGSAEELSGALLTQLRLSAPLGSLELVFSLTRLPVGPGGTVLFWLAAVLGVVLCGGFWLMYRLGLRQIALARQQQDFVSAVSHELKTPLTAIRMYGEMLREGWASEERRRTYYDYIHTESERLSRLINNVPQLARMTRRELQLSPRDIAVGELFDGSRPSIASQLERAGFALRIDCVGAEDAVVHVDPDCFAQILINLVDNAVKFSAGAERREVEIACRLDRGQTAVLSVRDYGPGVAKDQMKKIFRLFYRPAGELTRQTAGTGIGLALVRNLAEAMGGSVDVVNRNPGAEFQVSFPVASER
jgi:signal transduction histidine kinase